MIKETIGTPGGSEKPEDEIENGLKDMREYLCLEFGGEVTNIKHIEGFVYPFEDGDITVRVYEIELKSGEKFYGVGGGWPMPMNNYYKQQFSDPQKVADFHLYTIAKHFKIYNNDKELKEYADWLEIPNELQQ